jgi:cytochrome c peroxidase
LGERLFFDKRLSADGSVSCATCHAPDRAFSDGKPVSVGVGGLKGTRNAPSLLRVADHSSFFWDGRQSALESQVLEPIYNEREHGLKDSVALVAALEQALSYVDDFRSIYPDGISERSVASALASYVRSLSLSLSPSRFDRFQAGQVTALTGAERQGLEIFRGAAHCSSCHAIDGANASLTDNKFHSLSVGMGALAPTLAKSTSRAASLTQEQRYRLIASDAQISALGRFNVSGNPADIGKYRTPSLRNVAVTAPYMHDGSVATLEEAVELELYYRSAQQERLVILTPRERADLLAFLRTLTSESLQKKQGNP